MKTEVACQDIQPELVAWLDEQLEPARRQAVQVHLAGCPDCQAELAGLRLALGIVDDLPASQPSAGFEARFEERFERERTGWFQAVWTWLRRPLPAVALGSGLAALVLVSIWVTRPVGLDAKPDELAIARHLDLFADYEAIEKLDLLQDLDVLVALDDEV